jgi:hypothetical protein
VPQKPDVAALYASAETSLRILASRHDKNDRTLTLAVGPGRYCPPHHPNVFEVMADVAPSTN